MTWLDRGVEPLLDHQSVAPLHQFGLWALLRTIVGGPSDDARDRLRNRPLTLRRAVRGGLHYADAVAAGRLGDHEGAEQAYALGFVYTREEHRGQGLARAVVSAVTRDILAEGKLAVLYVIKGNEPAVRLYEGLGYTKHAEHAFMEGVKK